MNRVLLLIVAILFLHGCTSRSLPAPPPSLPSVRVARVRKEPFQPALKTFGTLTFTRKADVYSPQEGTIDTVRVEEGDRVTEGQVLATLYREKLLIAREQASSTVACREALLELAEEKLVEGYRSVEARLLAMEKAEAELAQKGVEYAHLSEVWETKKKLFQAGGIPGGDLESIRTQYLKSKTDWEQSARDLEIQRIGFRDEDLLKAGYSLPGSKAEQVTLLKELGTRTLKAERDVARGELSIARAELHRIELLLSETEIRSPLSGIVSQRAIERGEKVSPESLLFSIYDPESLYALLEVHERDLPRLRIGQFAEAFLEASSVIPRLTGRVRIISPYLNPQSRSTQVRILLDPPYNRGHSLQILPGMFARLTIPTGPVQKIIRIPESALLPDDMLEWSNAHRSKTQNTGDGSMDAPSSLFSSAVFIVRDHTLFKTRVVLGDRLEGKVEVREGLAEGDWVVMNPTLSLKEGERVEVQE